MVNPTKESESTHIATFAGVHCTLDIQRPIEGVIVLIFKGSDIGEFGDAPFQKIGHYLELESPVEVFIDARGTPSASIEVSGEWARWMKANRGRIYRLNLLCRSRFIELTANFVQRFTEFGSRMRIYTDVAAFDEALRVAIGASALAEGKLRRT